MNEEQVPSSLKNQVMARAGVGIFAFVLSAVCFFFPNMKQLAVMPFVFGVVALFVAWREQSAIKNNRYVVITGKVERVAKTSIRGRAKYFVVESTRPAADGGEERIRTNVRFYSKRGVEWIREGEEIAVYVPNYANVFEDSQNGDDFLTVETFWVAVRTTQD